MLKWGPPRVFRHRKLSMNLGPSLVRGSGGCAWGLPAPWEGVVHAGTHQAEGTYSGLQTWGNVWSSWVIREGDVLKKCSVISSVLQEWKPRSRMVWSWHLLWLLDEEASHLCGQSIREKKHPRLDLWDESKWRISILILFLYKEMYYWLSHPHSIPE